MTNDAFDKEVITQLTKLTTAIDSLAKAVEKLNLTVFGNGDPSNALVYNVYRLIRDVENHLAEHKKTREKTWGGILKIIGVVALAAWNILITWLTVKIKLNN